MRDLEMIGAPAAQAYPPTGLLVGLRESSGRDLGLGIVVSVHPETEKLICFTPIDPAGVGLLRWGSIKLDKTFSESPAAA